MSATTKLPPKDDPQREEREREAIKARDKATQVAGALKEGKLPTTEQVTRTIEAVQQSEALHDSAQGMSPLGKKVISDLEKLLDTTKQVFEEKNVGDELQNAIYYSAKVTKDASGNVTVPHGLKDKTVGHAQSTQPVLQDALKKVLLIPQLLISSSEFRKLINDIHSIVQDALLTAIPGNETEGSEDNQIGSQVGSDQEKTFQQAKQETAQQAREGTYPVAKEAADITGAHLKDYSEGRKNLKDTATGGARHLATHFKDKVSGYQITEEQRDRLVNRFKNLMIETQSKPEYQSVLEDLVDIISRLGDQAKEITGQTKEHTKGQVGEAVDRSDIDIARENAKRLIENFASHKSLDPLLNALKDLARDVKNDEELRSYLGELKQFTVSSIRDPQFVKETDYIQHGSKLIDRGRYLLQERYSDHTQRLADEAKEFNSALQSDRLTTQWTHDFENLINDTFLDENGFPTVKFELIKDFGRILPIVGEKLKYLPLPRIENSDEEYDYIFDNIVLYLAEFLPSHLRMSFTTDINLGRNEKDVLQNTTYIELSKINADARNIAFYYKKKKGLVTMMDVGLVDFSIPKDGLTIKLKILLNPPTDESKGIDLRVLEADTTIDDLKIRLHDTKHDFMYTLLTPLVEKRLKKQFANMISEKMVKSVEYIKDSIGKAHLSVRNQVGDLARKRKMVGEQVRKQKHNWQSDNYNTNPQANVNVREE